MDRDLERRSWNIVLSSVRRAARAIRSAGPGRRRRRRPVYSNALIVAMYLWSVWHDRCLSWACDRQHYGSLFRPPRRLPSVSQFTRRIKSDESRAILQRVHDDLSARDTRGSSSLSYLDGKPIVVSAVSKDPDAARGHVCGGFAKGYKLHAWITDDRRIVTWCVTPLNTDEKTIARELLLPCAPPTNDPRVALTLADGNYDAAPLYNAFAQRAAGAGGGHALLTPIRGEQFVGPRGRHPKTLRKMGPHRRAALRLWQDHPHLTNYVLRQRNNAEGVFSVLATALHLHGLPSFVRRIDRVRRWVGAKIILYHARLNAQARFATAAA